jgi:hypothetical protein
MIINYLNKLIKARSRLFYRKIDLEMYIDQLEGGLLKSWGLYS